MRDVIVGLFTKTELEKLEKHLNKKGLSFELKGKKMSFEIAMNKNSYSLFPYLKITNDDNFSFCVNLRKIEKLNYETLNNFNLKSKFFTAKVKSDILFLEYNTVLNDNVVVIFDCLVNELFALEEEIDNL